MTRIAAIDHVGVLVRDLDAAVESYRTLTGAGEVEWEDLPEQGVRVAVLRCGSQLVELLSPTRADTGVARYLENRGDGLHHVAYRVENVATELARLKDSGVRLVDEAPRKGFGGRLVAFVHPSGAAGVLTELVEPLDRGPGGGG